VKDSQTLANDGGGADGSGCVVFALVWLFFGMGLAVILVAPAVAAHIQLENPALFKPYGQQWLEGGAAAPPLALVLIRLASPRTGRLRGRRQDAIDSAHQRAGARPRSRRLAVLTGYLVRTGFLLAVANAIALVILQRGDDHQDPHVIQDGWSVFGIPALAVAVVLLTIHWWDGRPAPVTVETVRAVAQEADRTLRQVRAENRRLSRLAREVEAKLAAARSEVDFNALRNLHHESFRCANGAHAHYTSAKTSMYTMSQTVGRVRGTSHRWLGSTGRPATAQARRKRAELEEAVSDLATTHGQLIVEVERGLDLVRTLNGHTAELKHSIRDDCGERGQRWYEALEERIQDVRSNERRRPQPGW